MPRSRAASARHAGSVATGRCGPTTASSPARALRSSSAFSNESPTGCRTGAASAVSGTLPDGSSTRPSGTSARSTRPTPCGTPATSELSSRMPEVNVTIDGHKLAVPPRTLVVQAAKLVGIEIPVFCYHHKLDPVGACRLCLVELPPGPPRPQTACTTPVAAGMVVRTQTAMAGEARGAILPFEPVNHPVDCPGCDKGGECPLQDFTFRHR